MKERFMKNGVFSLEYDKETLKDMVLELQEENKILKENAENNDKVVDKVNWENMLLKKENQQLKEEHNKIQKAYESTFSDYQQIKDNWNKLKKYIDEANKDLYWTNNYDDILCVMQKLEQGSDSND